MKSILKYIKAHTVLCLLCFGFFLHITSITNTFLWDDEQFIVNNTYVANIRLWPEYFTTNTIEGAGFSSGYYRPLTTLSFALDRAIFGLHPLPFHITNSFLHATAGALLYLTLLSLFSYFGIKGRTKLISFVVALIFLSHPVQVEAVTFMNCRGDSLYTVFGLLSVYAYLLFCKEKNDNKSIVLSAVSLLFVLCSFLSKEIGIVFTAIPLGLTVMNTLLRKKRSKRMIVMAGVTLCIGLLYTLLRTTVFTFQSTESLGWPQQYSHSIMVRIATFILHVIPEYIKLFIFPYPLHMERSVPIIYSSHDVQLSSVAILIVSILLISLYIGFVWKRNKNVAILQLCSLCLSFSFLLPVSGVIPSNGLLYEHWLYMPIVGFFLCLLAPLLYIQIKPIYWKHIYIAMFTVICIYAVYSIRSILRLRTPIGFYTYTLKYAKTARLYNNLGMAYAEQGSIKEAEKAYLDSISLSHGYPQTYHNLANLYVQEKEYQKAKEMYEQALRVDPYFFFSINKLIDLEVSMNNLKEAKKWAEYGEQKFPQESTYINAVLSLNQAISSTQSGQLSPL